jgi:hypothetical protein
MFPIGYSGPWWICEKNQKLKISCQTPFKWERNVYLKQKNKKYTTGT